MNSRWVVIVSWVVFFAPAFCQAQGRWEKFQQKLDEFRPKGKVIQQIKDSLENQSSAANQKSVLSAVPTNRPQPKTSRGVPAQQASRRSILSTARNLPSGDVVLGIQIDPAFLPSQRLVVSEVESGSPAAKAGLRTGDQITSVGGIPTNTLKALDGVLGSLNGGDQVMIEFVRKRKSQKALVRFDKPVESPTTFAGNQPDPGAVELPPPQDMLDTPASSPNTMSSENLRSVLSTATPANSAAPSTRQNPVYFPADAASPPVVGGGQRDKQIAGHDSSDTPEQLRARIREQQRLIEQLQMQIQQLQQSQLPSDQGQIEYETLIIDPDGN